MADTDEPTAARLITDGVEVPLQDGMFHVGVDFARERTEQIRRAVDEQLDNYARRGWLDVQPQPTIRGEASLDIDFVQQPIRFGGLGLFEPAYLRRVDCVPYPEINKALTRWHANDEPSDPARAFWSWRNFGGGHGRVGLEVVITETDDDLWTWDSWTAALVVLAGVDDRVVGERRCPECRGRGLVFRWFASIADGIDAYPMHDHDREWSPAGGLGGVLYVSRELGRACIGLRCEECRGAKSVEVRLLDLVFYAAKGWPWALEQAQAIGDRLQATGDPWGLWIAALLEPRVWGGWVAYPTRRAVAGGIVQRLDSLVETRRSAGRSESIDAQAAGFGLVRGPGEPDEALRQRIIEYVEGATVFGGVRRAALARAGVMAFPDDRRLGWSEYRPASEVFSEADIERLAGVPSVGEVRVRGDAITLTFRDDEPHLVTTETVRRNLERLAAETTEEPDASERPHSPPIGRGLSRRLERGRRR